MEILYVLPFLMSACIIFAGGIYIIKRVKLGVELKKMIRENTTPRRAYIKDFLIVCHGINEYEIFPIIEDRLNQKFYISYGDFEFSYYSTYSVSYPGYYDYDVNLGGKKLLIGDAVDIYISKEIEVVKMEHGCINIKNIDYGYIGTKNELPKGSVTTMNFDQIANEANENFFEEVKELILYEGFIERVNYE